MFRTLKWCVTIVNVVYWQRHYKIEYVIKRLIFASIVAATLLIPSVCLAFWGKSDVVQMFGFGVTADLVEEPVEKTYTVEDYLNTFSIKYGVDVETASAIIRCESQFKPNATRKNYRIKAVEDTSGETIYQQYVWSTDIGYWQINDYYWRKELQSRGWDIYDPIQNLEAGFWIYSQYGASPWGWSKHCHHIS